MKTISNWIAARAAVLLSCCSTAAPASPRTHRTTHEDSWGVVPRLLLVIFVGRFRFPLIMIYILK